MSVNVVQLFRQVTLLQLYYFATVGFLILDYLFGVNVRLASLESHPVWRALYYLFCFGCLIAMLWRPTLSQLITTIESLITLSLLIIVMGARVLTYSDVLLDNGTEFITSAEIINFVISGGAAWIAYVRGAVALKQRL